MNKIRLDMPREYAEALKLFIDVNLTHMPENNTKSKMRIIYRELCGVLSGFPWTTRNIVQGTEIDMGCRDE